ncbi:hypothetical protein COU49_01975 [Candidatus Nomurabacteria bacterium CG10_big_fil_rev_8_21_14_0_10_35_16]|uniref:DUF5652 domain-containing protein n=1 Tax=Candidatus Nomurabacteria bacterium CG10_big_fil_rev_8_21_14_0_10_35_16 TaxID=1974731 RepID=A0A2H0TBA6_9BACT|nr:MAG: hypothetical protein COU49_01975 [Candidatus Nomurabacteria bacterium CG10_big_fil_rev_8_21_14_0_10_35_16]
MQNFIPFGDFELSGSQLIILFLIILWTLFWKGLALWHAVKRNERKWFIAILILNTFSILELIYLFFVVKIKRVRLD